MPLEKSNTSRYISFVGIENIKQQRSQLSFIKKEYNARTLFAANGLVIRQYGGNKKVRSDKITATHSIYEANKMTLISYLRAAATDRRMAAELVSDKVDRRAWFELREQLSVGTGT